MRYRSTQFQGDDLFSYKRGEKLSLKLHNKPRRGFKQCGTWFFNVFQEEHRDFALPICGGKQGVIKNCYRQVRKRPRWKTGNAHLKRGMVSLTRRCRQLRGKAPPTYKQSGKQHFPGDMCCKQEMSQNDKSKLTCDLWLVPGRLLLTGDTDETTKSGPEQACSWAAPPPAIGTPRRDLCLVGEGSSVYTFHRL